MVDSKGSTAPKRIARRAWFVVLVCACFGSTLAGCASPLPETDNRPHTTSDFIGRPRLPLP